MEYDIVLAAAVPSFSVACDKIDGVNGRCGGKYHALGIAGAVPYAGGRYKLFGKGYELCGVFPGG